MPFSGLIGIAVGRLMGCQMIVNSTLGYTALPVDPIVSRKSTMSADQEKWQTLSSPTDGTPPNPVSSSRAGSLLSPGAVAEVLKLTDVASTDSDTATKPWTITHDDVLNAVKQSKSYASGDVSAAGRSGNSYTSKDIAFIRATTGYNVISIGNLTAIVDDDGNPPPSQEQLGNVDAIVSAIDGARSFGGLNGEITPEFAKNMLNSLGGLIKSFPKDWMEKALAYVGGTPESKPAQV